MEQAINQVVTAVTLLVFGRALEQNPTKFWFLYHYPAWFRDGIEVLATDHCFIDDGLPRWCVSVEAGPIKVRGRGATAEEAEADARRILIEECPRLAARLGLIVMPPDEEIVELRRLLVELAKADSARRATGMCEPMFQKALLECVQAGDAIWGEGQ